MKTGAMTALNWTLYGEETYPTALSASPSTHGRSVWTEVVKPAILLKK
nr:MAG TPA: hypothetical protein [Caudoviricetes sp.]